MLNGKFSKLQLKYLGEWTSDLISHCWNTSSKIFWTCHQKKKIVDLCAQLVIFDDVAIVTIIIWWSDQWWDEFSGHFIKLYLWDILWGFLLTCLAIWIFLIFDILECNAAIPSPSQNFQSMFCLIDCKICNLICKLETLEFRNFG